jgi:hypothetical protein
MTHFKCGATLPEKGAARRVLLTRVKRESLGKYEAEPRRFIPPVHAA